MLVTDFDYDLPQELIAQHPMEPRDHSRLLVVDKKTGEIEHKHFYDLVNYLKPGDVLVFNDTRVIPARLHGTKDTGAHVEVFLLTRRDATDWEVLVRPGKKLQVGAKINFSDELSCEVIEHTDFGGRVVRFKYDGIFEEILDRLGETPLPPYITAPLEDKERYQTVYNRERGSAAAPTAGLHFTKELLQKIKEIYTVSQEAADAVNKAKAEGRRIIAVGTTAVRTLEAAGADGQLHAGSSWTNIFIYPGYKFRLVDDLVTNFHLPQSTLLMLVSTLSTREIMLQTYKKAVEEKYRFFSFGDAMFITDLNK